MEGDMERSFRLLENVLTPKHSRNLSTFSMKREKRTFGNASVSFNASYLDESNVTRASYRKISKIHHSDIVDLSLTTLAPNELSNLIDCSEIKPAGSADLDNLYQQFQETIETYGNTQQVFDAISGFIEACSVTLETLIYRDESGFKTSLFQDLSWLENERNTWRLVYALYRDRILHQNEEEPDLSRGLDPYEHPTSEREAMLELYKNESSVREGQLIIDWLERVARDDESDIGARLGHCVDRTVAWENTLHQLENTEVPYMSTRELVTALDPDAPTRQQKFLHDLDIEDEARLLDQIFHEIRRGCLDKAQELCIHCGQAWRAATLEGWKLHHDPNFRNDNLNEKLPIEGNAYRDIWKLCSWKLCDDERVPAKARAVMGALCGHLDALLTSCLTWEDVLWARVRVAVDRKVERAVRDAGLKEYVPMPDKYWNEAHWSLDEVLREMHGSEGLSRECESPDRVIQEFLALDRTAELVSRVAAWAHLASPQCLRFFAHLILVLRLLARSTPSDPGDSVITAYAKVLMKEGDPKLVAFYVALLLEEEQVELYAGFMESVTNNEKRQECLKAAESCSLDIKTITKRVVQNIRDRAEGNQDGEDALSKEVTQGDLQKISALDWVVYYPEQRSEALWEANALIRNFIGQGKLECARKAFDKIPPDSVELIMNQFRCKVDNDFRADLKALPAKVNSTIREYLCLKAYLDANEGFSDWFHNFHNTRPTAPTSPEEGNYSDKVAHEHRTSQYNKALERWRVTMTHQAKVVKAQLYNVIIFPDSGWLVDDFPEDEVRINQLQMLRNYCLPEIVMLLHKVLHSMEEYENCLDLASLVMDEEFGIYKVFNQHQLSDLLAKMAESSKILFHKCGDPFGDFGPDTDD